MPDTLINVQPCSQVCGTWDELFCICTLEDQGNNICSAPAVDTLNDPEGNYTTCYPGYNPGFVDSMAGLLGVYSTSCTDASTSPSTGGDTAVWSNIDNAKSDDGAYASISPSPIIVPSGGFAQICNLGTEYIVLTGFGLNLPSNATIWGISVGAKGHSTLSFTGTVLASVWNIALTQGGTLYYRADPRSYGFQQQGPAGVFTNCTGPPESDIPYPLNCGTRVPPTYYVQPLDNVVPGGDIASATVTSDAIGSLEWFSGIDASCPQLPQSGFGFPWKRSVIQKDMFIPTLKQSWTVAEINAPDFGIAFSLRINQQNAGAGSFPLYTYFLDCVGVAVYYTLGAAPPTGNPFVTGCEV